MTPKQQKDTKELVTLSLDINKRNSAVGWSEERTPTKSQFSLHDIQMAIVFKFISSSLFLTYCWSSFLTPTYGTTCYFQYVI